MRKLLLICSVILNTSCPDQCRDFRLWDWGFRYQVSPDTQTPKGILVDSTNQDLDPRIYTKIDELTSEVMSCLVGKMTCLHRDTICLDQGCLIVKIPDDWHYSELDPRQQLLRDLAPGCDKPGQQGDCYWRAGVQEGHIIITAPNLYLFKDALIKYITKCDNVWHSELAECANPGFQPDWLEN